MSVKLMGEIWPLQFRPKGDKFVLLALADAANDDGITWIAVRSRNAGKLDLMKKCSMSDRAIQGALNRLDEQGFIQRTIRAGKGVLYRIMSTPENPAGLTPELFAMTPENPSGKSLYNHNKKEADNSQSVDNLGICPLSHEKLHEMLSDEQWKAYLNMRVLINKPMIAYSSKLLVHKLNEIANLGWHPGDVCDRATVNGFTDIFPPKANQPSGIRRIAGKHVGDPLGATDADIEKIKEIDAMDNISDQLQERARFFEAVERRNKASSIGDILPSLPLDFDPRKSS